MATCDWGFAQREYWNNCVQSFLNKNSGVGASTCGVDRGIVL